MVIACVSIKGNGSFVVDPNVMECLSPPTRRRVDVYNDDTVVGVGTAACDISSVDRALFTTNPYCCLVILVSGMVVAKYA